MTKHAEHAAPKRYPPARERALRTWVALARCYSSVERASVRMVRSYGLTQPQFAVLEALYHLGPLPLSVLGGKLLVTGGNITYVVDNLSALELVARDRCATDRRVIHARLTPKGERLLAQIFPRHAEAVERLVGVLSPEEQDELRRLLKKLGKATERGAPADA